MRCLALLTALALSACSFSSEQALFNDSDAAQPFADGARFTWRAPDDPPMTVTFEREGAGYTITEASHADTPMTGVLLVAVPETTQEGYIVQWASEAGQSERAYAFMVRVANGYRVFSGPGSFEPTGDGPKPADAYCERRAYGECVFASRTDLLAYYQAIAYPALREGAATMEGALELTPLPDAATPRK
jgi:hypothetical protein